MAELTAKQIRFVAEYLVDLNATQAAIRAGYAPKRADAIGYENLRKPEIAEAIAEAQLNRAKRTGITQDRVLSELELLAFSDVTHYAVTDDGDVQLTSHAPNGAMRALQSIKRKFTTRGRGDKAERTCEVEIKLWEKPNPLRWAGQHVGILSDKHEHAGPGGGPLVVTFGGRHKEGVSADDKPGA
jgi:phage terminase small subunit